MSETAEHQFVEQRRQLMNEETRREVPEREVESGLPSLPYYARTLENLDLQGWGKLRVGVFQRGLEGSPDVQIGEFERNYTTLFRDFYPFKQAGRWYALYSPSYTATRVMGNDNRFGYIKLPHHLTLAQAVTVSADELHQIEIAVTLTFDRTTGQQWDYYGNPPPVKKEWE